MKRVAYEVNDGKIYFEEEAGVIYGCDKSFTEVDIPAKINGVDVTSIGDSAFMRCKNLLRITIPDSVTSIGRYAFSDCESLKSITIPKNVTFIGYNTFNNCKSLTSITIPDRVTIIEICAFYCCDSLTSITIPSSVETINYSVFGRCDSLTNINVDVNNKKLSSIDGVLFNKNRKMLVYYPMGKKALSYTIPDSVTYISQSAFMCCNNLVNVTIPNSVKRIEDCAFRECGGLKNITIPDSVTGIGDEVFFGISPDLTIYCNKNSCAEYYAMDNGIKYALI